MKREQKKTAEPVTVEYKPVETAEWLAKHGWKQLTYVIVSEKTPEGDWREGEVVQDPEGGLWYVEDWHGESGIPHRAERRRINREQARSMMVRFLIPEEFQDDFREYKGERLVLEDAVNEANAFMLLLTESRCLTRYGDFIGDHASRIEAGLNGLALQVGNRLTQAFYAGEF